MFTAITYIFASDINTAHCMTWVSSVILDCLFSNFFHTNMNKNSFVSTSYKVKRKMETSSLFFKSKLKSYSECLTLQEKYVCSLTTETIGLIVANSILLLFPKCIPVFFFPECYSCHCSTVDGAVDQYCILVICINYYIIIQLLTYKAARKPLKIWYRENNYWLKHLELERNWKNSSPGSLWQIIKTNLHLWLI